MDRRLFIVLLVLLAGLLIGWIIYVVSMDTQPVPVTKISSAWQNSGHADYKSESFIHWNEDEPAVVPENCAKCHSGDGFIDFIGADGSTAMQIDQVANINSVITCAVCHNDQSHALDSVVFPSGREVSGFPSTATCMSCHQGRASGVQVEESITDLPLDQASTDLSYTQTHYYMAGATYLGREATAGYEFPGKTYAGRYTHKEGPEGCTQCHSPHSLRVDSELCAVCHSMVASYEDFPDIRTDQTPDLDGDGDTTEGIAHEIHGLEDLLLSAMQAYSAETLQNPILFADDYPYFFNDTNADLTASDDEVQFGNSYKPWSPRLARAAYNLQWSKKDKGGYVHNPDYIAQLLYDSIEDLASVTPSFDMGDIQRP